MTAKDRKFSLEEASKIIELAGKYSAAKMAEIVTKNLQKLASDGRNTVQLSELDLLCTQLGLGKDAVRKAKMWVLAQSSSETTSSTSLRKGDEMVIRKEFDFLRQNQAILLEVLRENSWDSVTGGIASKFSKSEKRGARAIEVSNKLKPSHRMPSVILPKYSPFKFDRNSIVSNDSEHYFIMASSALKDSVISMLSDGVGVRVYCNYSVSVEGHIAMMVSLDTSKIFSVYLRNKYQEAHKVFALTELKNL